MQKYGLDKKRFKHKAEPAKEPARSSTDVAA
jgi:hypothetical protein